MSLRAAIYTRISDDEPSYDKPAVQAKNLRKLASANSYTVLDEFEDRVSAYADARGELKDRPGFTALMLGIRQGQYDVVLAVHQDRLSRNLEVAAGFRNLCRKHGVKIHTKTLGILDLEDPMSRAMSGVMDIFSELDVAVRMAKQADRFEDEMSLGQPLWGVRPFGYAADPNAPLNRHGKRSQRWTVVHPEEGEMIRWAYRELLKDEPATLYSIVKAFNASNFRTTNAGRTRRNKATGEESVVSGMWSYATIQQLLKRPRNAGIVVHRDVEQVGVKAAWEPLVSREDLDAVTAILTDPKRRTLPGRKPKHMVSSLAVCGVCGSVMRSASTKLKGVLTPVYKCSLKMAAQGYGERHPTIQMNLLDPLVREAVVAAFAFGSADMLPGETAVSTVPSQAELSALRAARARLVKLVAGGAVDEDDIAKELHEIKAREASLEDEILESTRARNSLSMRVDLRTKLKMGGGNRTSFEQVSNVKDALREAFDAQPLETQKQLIRDHLSITVYPGRRPERVSIVHKIVTTLNDDESISEAV